MKIQLRNISYSHGPVSSINQVSLIPEVEHTLLTWIKSTTTSPVPGVLIGGLAMSFYEKPRETTNVDLLFSSDATIPQEVANFKHYRPHGFQENQTHVEVKIFTPQSINIPQVVVDRVFATAVMYNDLRVASLGAMIVLKLYGSDTSHREFDDLADIVRILKYAPHVKSLPGWALRPGHIDKFNDARRRADEGLNV